MKKLGFLMTAIAFLIGALVAVRDKDSVRWNYYIGALAVGAAGVALARIGHRRVSRSEGKLTEDIESVKAALSGIVENVTRLNKQKESIDTYDVRHRIDELFVEDLARFVQGRESIAHGYGLSAYGEVMSRFAAGERYLNRVWSASADGYVDEVHMYLERARTQFAETLDKLKQFTEAPDPAETANS
jgi:hypothetical protein